VRRNSIGSSKISQAVASPAMRLGGSLALPINRLPAKAFTISLLLEELFHYSLIRANLRVYPSTFTVKGVSLKAGIQRFVQNLSACFYRHVPFASNCEEINSRRLLQSGSTFPRAQSAMNCELQTVEQ
jgi:hypothetical protein